MWSQTFVFCHNQENGFQKKENINQQYIFFSSGMEPQLVVFQTRLTGAWMNGEGP